MCAKHCMTACSLHSQTLRGQGSRNGLVTEEHQRSSRHTLSLGIWALQVQDHSHALTSARGKTFTLKADNRKNACSSLTESAGNIAVTRHLDLQQGLEDTLARFKIPEKVWIYQEPLPRGATEKIDKRGIREACLAGAIPSFV